MTQLEDRPYQERIHEKCTDYLIEHAVRKRDGVTRKEAPATIMIESPTGSGKTVMGLKICEALALGNIDLREPCRVVWMAHRRELLRQANESREDFFNIPEFHTLSMFDRTPERFRGYEVVVVDEAQHDASTSAQTIHSAIKPKIIIGLTATPYRADRAKLCFEKVVKDAGIHQLIREGWLSPFNQFMMEKEWTPENVAEVYLREPERWGKSVTYFLTIEEAKRHNEILRAHGVASELIVGNSPREEILDAFDSGELIHLSNVAVLTEGFDCPSLQTAFVRPSSKAPTVQMSGRVFRLHHTTPSVNIVQNVQSKYPFVRHATPIAQYLEQNGEWREVTIQDLTDFLKEAVDMILKSKIEMPDFLFKEKQHFTDLWAD